MRLLFGLFKHLSALLHRSPSQKAQPLCRAPVGFGLSLGYIIYTVSQFQAPYWFLKGAKLSVVTDCMQNSLGRWVSCWWAPSLLQCDGQRKAHILHGSETNWGSSRTVASLKYCSTTSKVTGIKTIFMYSSQTWVCCRVLWVFIGMFVIRKPYWVKKICRLRLFMNPK